jgi:hypothetical protein
MRNWKNNKKIKYKNRIRKIHEEFGKKKFQAGCR